MSWVKLSDDLCRSNPILEAGPAAAWLHICALSHCNAQLTDGFLPRGAIRMLADVDNAPELAERLVTVALWRPVQGGYEIVDYLLTQPSREKVLQKRAEHAAAQAAYAAKQNPPEPQETATTATASDAPTDSAADMVTDSVSDHISDNPPVPFPDTVPDPDPVPRDTGGARRALHRGVSWKNKHEGDDQTEADGYEEGDGVRALKPELRQALIFFGATKFQSTRQLAQYAALLREVGSSRFLEATHWAAKQGMALSNLQSIVTAARNGPPARVPKQADRSSVSYAGASG